MKNRSAKPNSAGAAPGPPLNRRRFLAAASSLATVSVMPSALVWGSQANARVTAGAVGLGGRGGWIANHVARHPGFQTVAVADYFPDRAKAVGQRLQVPADRCFSGLLGYRQLLEAGVEAVFLETPPFFFPEHARAALEAGCHVYVAKPIAVDVPGCLSIRKAGRSATRRGRVFLVDFQTRTDPKHIEAIRHVHAGMIGQLGLITSFYHDECFRDPPRGKTIANLLKGLAWVNDTALGGSYLVNCDIHAVDVALWAAGDVPVAATGYATRNRPSPHGDSDDCYAVSYEFRNGLVMSNQSEHVRNGTRFQSGIRAYGAKGHLEANYAGPVRIRGLDDGYAGGENQNLYAEGMQRNVDTFHRCIVEGNTANPTVEPSVNATLATILGREATRRRTRLTWTDLLADRTRQEPDLTGL